MIAEASAACCVESLNRNFSQSLPSNEPYPHRTHIDGPLIPLNHSLKHLRSWFAVPWYCAAVSSPGGLRAYFHFVFCGAWMNRGGCREHPTGVEEALKAGKPGCPSVSLRTREGGTRDETFTASILSDIERLCRARLVAPDGAGPAWRRARRWRWLPWWRRWFSWRWWRLPRGWRRISWRRCV